MPPSTSKVTPIRASASPELRAQTADRYGELQRQVDLFQPTLDEHKLTRERLVEMGETDPGEQGVVIRGGDYVVNLGARKNERTVVNQAQAFKALQKSLGAAGAIGAVTIPLGVLDRCTTAAQQKLFVIKEQTGSRSVEVTALQAVAA